MRISEGFLIYLAVMAGVTYLVRLLPLIFARHKIKNKFLRSFLYYVPYAVLIVLFVVEIIHSIAKKLLDNYCHADFVKFAINGAVLGLCIHNTHLSFSEALVSAFATGIGLTLTMTLFAKLREDAVDEEAVPASFRGLPISLLTAGMITLVVLALNFA